MADKKEAVPSNAEPEPVRAALKRFNEPMARDVVGLIVTAQPPKEVKVEVDIVCVHGLGAHPHWSWIGKNQKTKEEVNWIKDANMLPAAIPKARILRYGYDSQWVGEGTASKNSVEARAHDLLLKLGSDADRKINPKRPLIFICHCYGGLVVEQAICLAKETEGQYPNIFNACYGLILLGTPHHGTGDFLVEELVLRLVNAAKHMESDTIQILKPNDGVRKQLCERFLRIAKDTEAVRRRLKVHCFFETVRTRTSDVIKGMDSTNMNKDEVWEFVVSEESASLPDYTNQCMDVNHFQLNKFTGPDDGYYKSVKDALIPMVDNARLLMAEATITPIEPTRTLQGASTTAPPPFPCDKHFQGRKEILDQLGKKLKRHNQGRAFLVGESGTGKTHIAIQYAYMHHDLDTNNGFTRWIPAKTWIEFKRQYIETIEDSYSLPTDPNASEEQLLMAAKIYLENEESDKSWLLILDGIDHWEDEDLKSLKEYLPTKDCVDILVTTSNLALAKKLARESEDLILGVNKFTKEESLSLFRAISKNYRISDNDVSKLCEAVDFLPQAVAQAGAYFKDGLPDALSLPDYMKRLSELSILNSSKNLATAQIALQHIRKFNITILETARMASMYDNHTMLMTVFKEYEKNDIVRGEFFQVMKYFGLLQKCRASLSFNWTRRTLDAIQLFINPTEQQPATEIMLKAIPFLTEEERHSLTYITRCRRWLPYTLDVLDTEGRLLQPEARYAKTHAKLYAKIARYHLFLRNFDKTEYYLNRSRVLTKQHEIPELLEELDGLAEMIKNARCSPSGISAAASAAPAAQSAPVEAKPTNFTPPPIPPIPETTQPVPSDVPGQDKPLDGYIQRSRSIFHKRDVDDVTNKLKTLVGNENDKIRAQDALALIYAGTQRHKLAAAHYQQTYTWCVQTHGEGSFHTHRQVFKMAQNDELQGKLAQAELKYHDAHRGIQKSLGSFHPEASRILSALAALYAKQGKRHEAAEAFQQAMRLQHQDPGPDHPDSLLTAHNYAVFLQGESPEAAGMLLEKVLREQSVSPVLGSDHPDTLKTASSLLRNYEVRGRLTDALALYSLLAPKQRQVFGDNHAETMAIGRLMDNRVL
ncbi:hypothetical protein VHEMI01291 [[Torrubiella] hemipterigena]|uniref:NB-ARC domain-containing protein n=1 Tax=[Torrubiella] hemipterigena TaxID=1531966 RepID=A0A0A1SSS2_9HYPO|nr:hypothetical protein VHEMI01291 [[Torrubiella] hemipterigena]